MTKVLWVVESPANETRHQAYEEERDAREYAKFLHWMFGRTFKVMRYEVTEQ